MKDTRTRAKKTVRGRVFYRGLEIDPKWVEENRILLFTNSQRTGWMDDLMEEEDDADWMN